ncbi:MAG TPA: hypothetical protein DCP69_10145 [Candidatus Omnitrophica bacterium]|nr:hypothetical protein [Candidatus Omnitrophota bacterium]
MSEPIDLAALRYDDEHGCGCGSCSVCHWQDLARAAAAAIEQKDAALREIKGHCRYALDTSGMRVAVPRLSPSMAKWLESIVDPALALTKKGGA